MRPRRGVHLPLALFWLVYMAGMGVFFPYFSLYLRQVLGFSGTEVGLVVAMIPLAGLLAQPLWGLLADLTGARQKVLAAATLGTAATYLLLGGQQGLAAVLVATAALASFQQPVLPMAVALTLAAVGQKDFGYLRLWGTVGFLALVVTFPHLGSRGSEGDVLVRLFPTAAVLTALAAVLALTLPRYPAASERAERGDLRRLLGHRPLRRLVLLTFAAHCSIQGPIQLFGLFLDEHGGNAELVGHTWVIMLLLEIPLIALSGPFLRRWAPRALLRVGLLAEGLRWTTCALTDELAVIQAVQVLHGVGVAGLLVGIPLYAEAVVPGRLRSTAQGLVAVGVGAGVILSSLAGGWAFEHLAPAAPYAAGGIGALVLGLSLGWWLPTTRTAGIQSISA